MHDRRLITNNPLLQSWCLTFHNTNYKFEESAKKDQIRYFIAGKETCPTTAKEHLQGYVEFTKPQRLTGVKKNLGDTTVHCEARRGTREQARDYCKKEDANPYEYGNFTEGGQGTR